MNTPTYEELSAKMREIAEGGEEDASPEPSIVEETVPEATAVGPEPSKNGRRYLDKFDMDEIEIHGRRYRRMFDGERLPCGLSSEEGVREIKTSFMRIADETDLHERLPDPDNNLIALLDETRKFHNSELYIVNWALKAGLSEQESMFRIAKDGRAYKEDPVVSMTITEMLDNDEPVAALEAFAILKQVADRSKYGSNIYVDFARFMTQTAIRIYKAFEKDPLRFENGADFFGSRLTLWQHEALLYCAKEARMHPEGVDIKEPF